MRERGALKARGIGYRPTCGAWLSRMGRRLCASSSSSCARISRSRSRRMPQIKGDAALKMIPVVMMTSSREEQDLLISYQLGVNAYVVKPMKFHDFVEAVKQVGGFWAVINE